MIAEKAISYIPLPRRPTKTMKLYAVKALNFFGYAPVENPLPGLNVLLTLVHLHGTIAFLYAFVDSSRDEVTVYKTDQPLSTCTSMLAIFTCRTSDYDAATSTGHKDTNMNSKNCTLRASDFQENSLQDFPLSLCDRFTNVCISTPISVGMSQALACSTSLMRLLALIYNFQCMGENQKKEGPSQQESESL